MLLFITLFSSLSSISLSFSLPLFFCLVTFLLISTHTCLFIPYPLSHFCIPFTLSTLFQLPFSWLLSNLTWSSLLFLCLWYDKIIKPFRDDLEAGILDLLQEWEIFNTTTLNNSTQEPIGQCMNAKHHSYGVCSANMSSIAINSSVIIRTAISYFSCSVSQKSFDIDTHKYI